MPLKIVDGLFERRTDFRQGCFWFGVRYANGNLWHVTLQAIGQKLRANSTSVLTPNPLPPASIHDLLDSRNAGPAMSRWTHGLPPTNSSRNLAAVMAPPQRPSPTFLMSATSLRICSPYSGNIGNCHSGSPLTSPADLTASAHG